MCEDIHGVFIVDQRVQAVSGGVLDLVFAPDPRGQRRIGARFASHLAERVKQRGVTRAEIRHAGWIFGIQDRPVGEHDAQSPERVIAVVRRAATHARGIVGGNAADFARVDRCRVGADLAAAGSQARVHLATDGAGAEPHVFCIRSDLAGGEPLADQRQHAIGHGLPGKARAGCAKRDGSAMGARDVQDCAHVGFAFDHRHDFGHQAIEARIRCIGKSPQLVRNHLPWR